MKNNLHNIVRSKASVIPLQYNEVYDWITQIHYAHRMPNIKYSFGLQIGSEIMGIITFGIPASPFLCMGTCGEKYKNNVLELNRLVINEDSPHNSASFLIANAIKLLPPDRILVSYADTNMNHVGYVYQAVNWIYTGLTKARTDMFAGKRKHSRHHQRDRSRRQYRSAKHRYIYFHKCEKEIRKALKYPILPYPKGDVSKYIVSTVPSQLCLEFK